MKLMSVAAMGVGCLALSALTAQAASPGPFFTASAGLNLVDNFDIGAGAELDFDPGFRVDVGVGYTFHENESIGLSAGFETGLLYNSMDKGVAPGGSVPIEGDLWQVPVLGKLVLRFMPESAWVPYIGVGGGVVYGRSEVERIGGAIVDLSGDEWDPAVQAMAGVKYKLNDNSAVGLGYKALFVFPGDGFEEVLNHAIQATFALHF